MKKTNLLRSFLLIVLIAALAFSIINCAPKNDEAGTEKTFTFEVYLQGESTPKSTYEITTEKETVGEALVEKGLIEGENGQYGLYVKKVDGVFAEYETTGTYWAFYVNGEYGMSGVDSTKIENGAVYSFRVE